VSDPFSSPRFMGVEGPGLPVAPGQTGVGASFPRTFERVSIRFSFAPVNGRWLLAQRTPPRTGGASGARLMEQ